MQLNNAIKSILEKRGISAADDVAEFLSEKPQKTYDPFLLLNMEEGVDLILSAIEDGKKICIYGDYDSDGVTSVVLLRNVIMELGGDVMSYIPSRFDDGYGLNARAIDKIKEAGAQLVITVDCGCTSVDEVKHAKEIGLEIMVTDHHTLKDEKPDCILIDPMQEDCTYPFKYLAGVGVAFKLAQALVETVGMPKDILTRNLDLVGIGTIVDIVPLVDENRTLAKYGLRTLNITERVGLNALIEHLGLKQGEIDSRKVSYVIGPHINAAGRVRNAALSARLLQTDSQGKAEELAEKIIECNTERKELQDKLQKTCHEMIDTQEIRERGFILLSPEEAHEGIIGIVAGKLKEDYGVPVLLTTHASDGVHKGTGRSPAGINLFNLLTKYGDLFTRLGGHAGACGFSIKEENIPLLKEAISREMQDILAGSKEGLGSEAEPEIIMDPSDINMDYIVQQKLLEPFGRDNPEPTVGIMVVPQDVARTKDGKFLRFSGRLGNNQNIKCMDFRNADLHEQLLRRASEENRYVTAIGNLDLQVWNDNEYIQMNVKAINAE